MRIWHLNVGNHAGRVDGVAMMSTRLAAGQAADGHDAHLWVVAPPEHESAVLEATPAEVTLQLHRSTGSACSAMLRALRDPAQRPDVVHVHSVFRPVHAVVAESAQRLGIPVVQTPHAGLDPTLLERDRTRKELYRWAVERWMLRRADAVVALQQLEVADVRRFSGRRRPVDVIANAVDDAALTHASWAPPAPGARPVALMLSRYDVLQKGLDRVVAMGAQLPHVEFRIHGHQDKNQPERSRELIASAPANVRFLPPVYDGDKYRALREASVFLLPSRAEGVSLALTEAMTLGVPCAVSRFVDRSLDLGSQGAAVVLDDDPGRAARQLDALVQDRTRLAGAGAGAAGYAAEHFAPARVRDAYLSVYRRALRAQRLVRPVLISPTAPPAHTATPVHPAPLAAAVEEA